MTVGQMYKTQSCPWFQETRRGSFRGTILSDRGKRRKKPRLSQRRALLACPVSQQEGEERSPALPLCLPLSSPPTHYIGLRRRRLWLPVELGA